MERREIVEGAVALLDQHGESGVTMRALAGRLQISAPSLYWHYPSKRDLLEDVADALVADVALGRGDPAVRIDPAQRLLVLLGDFRRALLGHRDGGRVFAGTFTLGPHVLDLSEAGTSLLVEAGAACAGEALDTWFNLVRFVVGSVIEEQGAAGQPELAGRRAVFREANAHRPTILAATERVFAPDEDRRFEDGVRRLIQPPEVRRPARPRTTFSPST
ncbi:TetR family transcriptional regulator [Pseudonocardia sp. TMWB2A]|uniref:TetR/AcrR family transcriptional regulator n=1 Tax=Pseudonocardia sp. TMWB2A TaxID=687430 RepID=UPI00307EEAC8